MIVKNPGLHFILNQGTNLKLVNNLQGQKLSIIYLPLQD